MPSSLFRFFSAAVCCSNSPTTDVNGHSTNLHRTGGDHTTTRNSSIQIPTLPTSSSPPSSQPAPACSFSLLSSLNTPTSSSSSSAAALAISGHSPPLLCAASELYIVIYDLTDLRPVASAVGRGSGSVKSVAFSADGARIFTAHQDRRIRVWSTSFSAADENRRLRLVAKLPTLYDCLWRFAFPRNYVPIRRHKRTLWVKHADVVSSLATNDDFLYSASWDKTIKVWHASSKLRCLESLPAHDDAVNAVAAAPDGVVYTASADSLIKVWMRPALSPPERNWRRKKKKKKKKKRKLALVATLEKHSPAVNALALSPDASVLYSGASDRLVVVWERVESGDEHMNATAVLRGHEKAVMCLATVDGLVVSGSTDRTVRIWRRGVEYQCIAVLVGHQKGVRSVAAWRVDCNSSNMVEYKVCSGSVDGEVRIWRVWVSR